MKLIATVEECIIRDGMDGDLSRELRDSNIPQVDGHYLLTSELTLSVTTERDRIALTEIHQDILDLLIERGFDLGEKTNHPILLDGKEIVC